MSATRARSGLNKSAELGIKVNHYSSFEDPQLSPEMNRCSGEIKVLRSEHAKSNYSVLICFVEEPELSV